MITSSPDFIAGMSVPLGWFYLTVCAMNVVAAWRARRSVRAIAWTTVAIVFAGLAARSWAGHPLCLPDGVKAAVDRAVGPLSLYLGATALLAIFFLGRVWKVGIFRRNPRSPHPNPLPTNLRLVPGEGTAGPALAWTMLNISLLLLGASLADPQFAAVVLTPDNVPIVGMVYLLAFFLWLAMVQAVENDRRIPPGAITNLRSVPGSSSSAANTAGQASSATRGQEKFLAWPDLVYIELIAMILIMALLVVWSVSIPAPLEQPATATLTPNPAKAPWYFVGLQELLVSSDAWLVGVVLLCAIVLGLMAIPYLDFTPLGSGYYTIRQRRFALAVFLFGFLVLWIVPILIGTLVRGPNWNAFGPYQARDPEKLLAVQNVKLSQWFWTGLLGRPVPRVPDGCGPLLQLATSAWREVAGLVFVTTYFLALPPLLGRTVFREFRLRMGGRRYTLMILLLLLMVALTLKIALRWAFGLSCLVSIPEWSLNF